MPDGMAAIAASSPGHDQVLGLPQATPHEIVEHRAIDHLAPTSCGTFLAGWAWDGLVAARESTLKTPLPIVNLLMRSGKAPFFAFI